MIWLLAAIAFVRTSSMALCPSASTCVVTMTVTAGDTIAVGVTYGLAASCTTDATHAAPTAVSDSGGSTYTKRSSKCDTGANQAVEVWTTGAGAALSSIAVTITWGNGTTDRPSSSGAIAGDYGGALAIGSTGLVNNGNSNNPTISFTLQAANDWFVAFLGQGTNEAPVAQTGNLRGSANNATIGNLALIDNTAASASSVTDSFTQTTADIWEAAGVELCVANPCVAAGGVTPIYNQRNRRGH